MNTTLIIAISIAVLAVVALTLFFSYNNKEIALRKEAEAQRGNIEAVHDKMLKSYGRRRMWQPNTGTHSRRFILKSSPDATRTAVMR